MDVILFDILSQIIVNFENLVLLVYIWQNLCGRLVSVDLPEIQAVCLYILNNFESIYRNTNSF